MKNIIINKTYKQYNQFINNNIQTEHHIIQYIQYILYTLNFWVEEKKMSSPMKCFEAEITLIYRNLVNSEKHK